MSLDSLGNPDTIRSHGIGVGKTAERLGEARSLALVADDEIGEALELLWGTAAVNTWNSRRAGVLAWPGYCPGSARAVPAGRCSSPTAARGLARSSARATSAQIPG